MDNADHTAAVTLLFFGRHISARLQLSSQAYNAGVDARVLVKRSWNSLLHMESAVLAACRRRLNAPPSGWEELCNSLIAIILLENLSLIKALDELMDGRMVSTSSTPSFPVILRVGIFWDPEPRQIGTRCLW